MPPGLPFNGAISRGGEPALDRVRRKRDWNRYLRNLEMDWSQIKQICMKFGTAPPPPFNPWWSDLPLSFTVKLIEALLNSKIKSKGLRIPDVVQGWSPEQKIEDYRARYTFYRVWPRWTEVETHGVIKSSLLVLGIQHHHRRGDIVIPSNWEALLEGLGLEVEGSHVKMRADAVPHVTDRVAKIRAATETLRAEDVRREEIEAERDIERVRAQTAARQRGMSIAETEKEGDEAAEAIEDPGHRTQRN